MENRIVLNRVSVTYRVDLSHTTTLKEWAVAKFSRSKTSGPRFREVEALKNLTLTVDHGERLGVIGLNGAGKSTLLKVMSGLLRPTQGTIEVIGTVQPMIELGAGFNPEFSGRENIYFNGAMLGFTKKQVARVEKEVIGFAELEDAIDLPVKTYSSGMNARLAFSIATIIKPEILLLDEMLAAGDAPFQEKARKRMASLVDDAKILVLVSHNVGLVQSLCPRTILLSKGEIVFDGPSAEAVAEYAKNTAPQ